MNACSLKKLDQQGFQVFIPMVETITNFPEVKMEVFSRHSAVRIQPVFGITVFDETRPANRAVDDKTLNIRVDGIIGQRKQVVPPKPPANHPWRRYPEPKLSQPSVP